MPIVDSNGLMIAILGGQPADYEGQPPNSDWRSVEKDSSTAMKQTLDRLKFSKNVQHRRGAFGSLRCGVSYGGGQTCPMNLANNASTERILNALNSKRCFRRIAGFQSCMASFLVTSPRLTLSDSSPKGLGTKAS